MRFGLKRGTVSPNEGALEAMQNCVLKAHIQTDSNSVSHIDMFYVY